MRLAVIGVCPRDRARWLWAEFGVAFFIEPSGNGERHRVAGATAETSGGAAGAACPVTPVSSRNVSVTDPRSHGPFYLGGPMPHGHFPWNKTVWVLADGARGPVLFRSGRVDGTDALKFSGNPADHADTGITPSSGAG